MARDLVAAVISLLKADDALEGMVNGRVFGVSLPSSEAVGQPRAAVVVHRSSGFAGMNGFLEIETGAVDVLCYGETALEADAVHVLVRDALKQARRQLQGDVLLHSFEPMTGAVNLVDSDTDAPLLAQTWRFMASEIAAT